MDEELFARSFASLCGALTVLADNADPKRKTPKDPMERGLAYADCWLDMIMPKRLHVDSQGKASFATKD